MLIFWGKKNVNTRKESTEALLDPSREVGLEINVRETKCIFLSHYQNGGQNHNIKVANKTFENVTVQIFWNDKKSELIS
jgi:hypothetical protein